MELEDGGGIRVLCCESLTNREEEGSAMEESVLICQFIEVAEASLLLEAKWWRRRFLDFTMFSRPAGIISPHSPRRRPRLANKPWEATLTCHPW